MEGYMKTVNFGGFDKIDVLKAIDMLGSDIFILERMSERASEIIDSGSSNPMCVKRCEIFLKDYSEISLHYRDDILLKTVSFGGFDKKDVLSVINDKKNKIASLESELCKTADKLRHLISEADNEVSAPKNNSAEKDLAAAVIALEERVRTLEVLYTKSQEELFDVIRRVVKLEK